jgi:uncharacterized protein YbaR (Trm112 family)
MNKNFNPKLLEILRCPKSKGELFYDQKNQELICYKSSLAYKIIDGIPIMLIEKARSIN